MTKRNDKTTGLHERLLTPEQAAAYLHLNPRTLANWRSRRQGPPYIRCGRMCLYDPADLDAWLTRQRVGTVA